MCPPSLHISLGVWFKLYTLLEEECNGLIESIVEALADTPQTVHALTNGPFPFYVAKRCEVVSAKNRVQEITKEIDELQEQLAVVMLISDTVDVSEATADQIKELKEELARQVGLHLFLLTFECVFPLVGLSCHFCITLLSITVVILLE